MPRGQTYSPTAPLASKPKVRALKHLKQWIEDGRLPGGERLPSEQALAVSLKVARSAVRSALQQLEDEGLVRPEGLRGRMVAESVRPVQSVMSQTIAIITDAPDQPPVYQRMFGWEIYTHVGTLEAIRAAGLHALTLNVQLLASDQVHRLIADKPKGVIARRDAVVGKQGRELLDRLGAAGIPVVVYGAAPQLTRFDTVASDHFDGSHKLASWLIQQGCRRILRVWALQNFDPRPAWLDERDRGFEKAIAEHGLELLPQVEMVTPVGEPQTREAFEMHVRLAAGHLLEHISKEPGVDAIMAASDGQCYAMSAAIRLFGKVPGRDIKIVGYDNYWPDVPEQRWEPSIPAATVDKQNLRIGHELIDLLLARVAGKLPPEPQLRMVEPRLVITSTHGIPLN